MGSDATTTEVCASWEPLQGHRIAAGAVRSAVQRGAVGVAAFRHVAALRSSPPRLRPAMPARQTLSRCWQTLLLPFHGGSTLPVAWRWRPARQHATDRSSRRGGRLRRAHSAARGAPSARAARAGGWSHPRAAARRQDTAGVARNVAQLIGSRARAAPTRTCAFRRRKHVLPPPAPRRVPPVRHGSSWSVLGAAACRSRLCHPCTATASTSPHCHRADNARSAGFDAACLLLGARFGAAIVLVKVWWKDGHSSLAALALAASLGFELAGRLIFRCAVPRPAAYAARRELLLLPLQLLHSTMLTIAGAEGWVRRRRSHARCRLRPTGQFCRLPPAVVFANTQPTKLAGLSTRGATNAVFLVIAWSNG